MGVTLWSIAVTRMMVAHLALASEAEGVKALHPLMHPSSARLKTLEPACTKPITFACVTPQHLFVSVILEKMLAVSGAVPSAPHFT